MAVGDKEAAVSDCVVSAIKARGFVPPFDGGDTMNGKFQYQFETMIAFHRRVKACLAAKGYSYGYPESRDYMNATLAMTLTQIRVKIGRQTGLSAHLFEMTGSSLETSVEASAFGAEPDAGSRKAAKKRKKKARAAKK